MGCTTALFPLLSGSCCCQGQNTKCPDLDQARGENNIMAMSVQQRQQWHNNGLIVTHVWNALGCWDNKDIRLTEAIQSQVCLWPAGFDRRPWRDTHNVERRRVPLSLDARFPNSLFFPLLLSCSVHTQIRQTCSMGCIVMHNALAQALISQALETRGDEGRWTVMFTQYVRRYKRPRLLQYVPSPVHRPVCGRKESFHFGPISRAQSEIESYNLYANACKSLLSQITYF